MIVYLNGRFVPEDQALISVFDRGFLYGDALFETVRVFHSRPFRWQQHLERLAAGSRFLRLPLPVSFPAITDAALELVTRNALTDAFLRITLSRGVGPRGYSPKGAEKPTLVLTLHPANRLGLDPVTGWRLIISCIRLPAGDPLARHKTANKLPQVLARAEADLADADEALLMNTAGHVVEGASSNLFWVAGNEVFTSPLPVGVLPGVTRSVVIELCSVLGIRFAETEIAPTDLAKQDGVFVSLSTAGVVPGISLNGTPLRQSGLVDRLVTAYRDTLLRETTAPGSPLPSAT